MTLLLVRLAFAGIRSRLLASVLTVLLTGAAAATIVLTLEVSGTAADPWARTFEAAHGAHVLADVASEADARTVAGMPGVAEYDEPVPVAPATMILNGKEVVVFLAAIDAPPRINAPLVVDGSAAGSGAVMLERSLARALGIDPGTDIAFATETGQLNLSVAGTAISPSQSRYPRSNPGLGWVTRDTLEQIEPDHSRWHWLQAVRLTDPAFAPTFAATGTAVFPPGSVLLVSWQDQRASALLEAQPFQLVLMLYTLLLLIVSFAVVTILIGARASSQHREIGLLKAIGLTPHQVSAVFVLEATTLGLLGAVAGFIPGALLAPRLVAPTATTLLGPPTVAANPWHILVAAAIIVPVIAASAFVSAQRSTRATVLQALRAGATTPASRSRVGRIIAAADLPIPMMLGLKDLLGRHTRALWLMFAIAVTGAAMVITLSVQATLATRPDGEPSDVSGELPALIFTLDAVLALIVLSALAAVALLSVRERIRDFGVLRAIGLTPMQVVSSLVGAHVVLALVASLVSIPIGVGLYLALYQIASDGTSETPAVIAPWWWLAAIPIAIPLATALATGLPARLATRIPAAEAVRYE